MCVCLCVHTNAVSKILALPATVKSTLVYHSCNAQCFPQEGGGGGGGGGGGAIEDLEAVYARSHTLLAYTTIMCCVNTVKGGGCAPLPPLVKNTDACTDFLISDL